MPNIAGVPNRSSPYDFYRYCRNCQEWVGLDEIRCKVCRQRTRGRSFVSQELKERKREKRRVGIEA